MSTNAIDVLDNNDPNKIDIRGLLEQYLGNTNTQLEKQMGNKEQALQQSADALQKGAAAGTELVKAQQAQKVLEGQRIQKFAKTLGADVSDPQSKINISAQMYSEATGKIQEDIKSIETGESVKFLDSPGTWLAAHWALPGERSDLMRHTKEAVTLAQSMQNTNAVIQSTADSTKLLTEVTTQKMAADAVTAAGAKLQSDAADKAATAFGGKVNDILALQGLSDAQLGRIIQVYTAQASDEQRRILRAQRLEKVTDDAQFLTNVNSGRKQIGLRPTTLTAAKQDKKGSEFFNNLGAQADAGIESISDSPGAVGVILSKYQSGLQGSVPTLLRSLKDVTIAGISSQGGKVNDDTVTAGINTNLFGQGDKPGLLKTMYQNASTAKIPFNGKVYDNPYTAPDVTTIAATNKAVLDSTFGQKVLTPALNVPVQAAKNSDPAQLLDAAASAMVTDKLQAADMAGGIAQFYKTAVAYNNAHKNYKKFALPPQSAYIVNGIDVTDAAAVSRYLTAQAIKLNLAHTFFPWSK